MNAVWGSWCSDLCSRISSVLHPIKSLDRENAARSHVLLICGTEPKGRVAERKDMGGASPAGPGPNQTSVFCHRPHSATRLPDISKQNPGEALQLFLEEAKDILRYELGEEEIRTLKVSFETGTSQPARKLALCAELRTRDQENHLAKGTAGHIVVTKVSSRAPALPCTEQRQHVCPLTSRPAHHTEASCDQSTHSPMQTSVGPQLLRLQIFCLLVELWERPEQILCAL